jgi:glyoxylase-like metal-dependent hydrolase (beta-lactamase superfamily II)
MARAPGVRRDLSRDGGFVEVADRCWVARHRLADVNVTVVGGTHGLVVVDTHSSAATGRAVVERVRALGAGDVVAVVNTHAHWDHVLGSCAFVECYDGVTVIAHEVVAATLAEQGAAMVAQLAAELDQTGTEPVVPAVTFSSARVMDLGDRQVELLHPGRGHTAGDAVVWVGDADLLVAGDLVEESEERGHVPGFGDDSFPLEWPATLDLVLGMLRPTSTVVPGHGNPVDRDFVTDQRDSIGQVAETIRRLAAGGVRPEQMAAAGQWPYPAADLEHAFRRGFTQLPRTGRSLPLL